MTGRSGNPPQKKASRRFLHKRLAARSLLALVARECGLLRELNGNHYDPDDHSDQIECTASEKRQYGVANRRHEGRLTRREIHRLVISNRRDDFCHDEHEAHECHQEGCDFQKPYHDNISTF